MVNHISCLLLHMWTFFSFDVHENCSIKIVKFNVCDLLTVTGYTRSDTFAYCYCSALMCT